MVEAKINDSDLVPKFPVYTWFWQSDPNPWKETDRTKWTWTPYPDDISSRITEAVFSKQQPTVNLGNYEIDLTKMLQINKIDRNKIRRVKKEILSESEHRFLTEFELPKPFQQGEKTANPAFGNVKCFLNYIMKRTPAAYKLYKKLQDLHLDSEDSQYKDIIEEVICSIVKAAEQREKVIKSRLQNPPQNCILEAEQIARQIKLVSSRPLRDFLQIIVIIYTMESYLCYYLNELLRNEKWEELNVLTPYVVCLAYTFQIQDYVLKLPQEGKIDYLKRLFKKRRLTLYRGATLTEEHLKFYREMKEKHFSWNGVTSTSRSMDVAASFLKLSLAKAKIQDEKKVGVIFKIETDFELPKDCEGMIDISGYSKFPKEQEIILAPGIVFEIVSIKCNQQSIYEIKLSIKKIFNNIKEQIPLLGTLQLQVIKEDKAFLNNLTNEEFIKALQLLQGNKLVYILTIKSCVINDYLIKLIEDIRVTTKLKEEDIILAGNRIVVPNLQTYFKYFILDSRLKYNLVHNQIVFSQEGSISENKAKICKLIYAERLFGNLQLEEFFRRVTYEFEVEELILELDTNMISNNRNSKFMETIKEMPVLKKLCINARPYFLLRGFDENTFDNLLRFAGLMVSLNSLSVLFGNYSGINEDKFSSLKDALKMLTSLQHLTLDFQCCNHISDTGLYHLKDAFKMLTSLQHLSLDFRYCTQISDTGLNCLKEAFEMLTSLQNLSLDFQMCKNITDNGLNHIKDTLKILLCNIFL